MSKVLRRRFPAYMGGLLLSLAAMVAIMTAKKAFAPRFHEIRQPMPPAELGAGGIAKIVYEEEPGYFLPPGFPSKASITRKGNEPVPVIHLAYRQLTEREVRLGPLNEPGQYLLETELYVCDAPGVADCAKLLLSQELTVKAGAPAAVLVPLGLKAIAQRGLEAGRGAAPAPAEKQ